VLEYAEGGDALHYVQSSGALGEDRARTWSMQVTSAVTYMHDLGIAHRDLKLENLLLTGDLRTIKICDFGFVRRKTVSYFFAFVIYYCIRQKTGIAFIALVYTRDRKVGDIEQAGP